MTTNLERLAALTPKQMDELMALVWAMTEGYTIGTIPNPRNAKHPFITLTPPKEATK